MEHERRWKMVALVATGVAIGVIVAGTPAGAHIGSVTHLWSGHIRPKADARYLPGGYLPRGKTIRGTYIMYDVQQGPSTMQTSTAISFGWRVRSPLVAHWVPWTDPTPPAACPGTSLAPTARPGHLCVYEDTSGNLNGPVRIWSNHGNGTSWRFGAQLQASSAGLGVFGSEGSWAATSGG